MTTIFDDSTKELACKELLNHGIHQSQVKYMDNPLFVTFCLKKCFGLSIVLHSQIHQYLINEIHHTIKGEPLVNNLMIHLIAPSKSISENFGLIYNALIKLFTLNSVAPNALDWIIPSNSRQIRFIQLTLSFLHLKIINKPLTVDDIIIDGNIYIYPTISPLLGGTIFEASTQTSDTKKSYEIIKTFLNCCQGTWQSKIAIINHLNEQWIRIEKTNKYQQWKLKNKSDELNSWLIEQDIFGTTPQIQHLVERCNFSKLDKIELHFDALYFLHPDTAELKIQKLKKSWSQNKTRGKNSNKKQSNFILSLSTKKLLEETCNTEGCSMSELVNTAIQKECDRINEKNKASNQ